MSRRAWTVPSVYAASAIAAGFMLPRLEGLLLPQLAAGMSVSAAMAIYSSIASGMIALTGIVFSLVFVMVQFSATAYSPRLVMWVAKDPFIAHTLGVFTATFLYAIAALAWLDREGGATVPILSALVVILLLLASVAMFIGLIERVALLRVNKMLAFTGGQGRRVINAIYPDASTATADGRSAIDDSGWRTAPTQTVLYAGVPAVVQRFDVPALVALARRADAIIEVVPAVGDTLLDSSSTLASVFGAAAPLDEQAIRRAIVIGEERTFEQDPRYALRLLVDIAIRALSPAVNDPTTAVQALDQIGDLLLRLARRRLEVGSYRDADGVLRLIVTFPTWDDFLRLSFDEIQAYGCGSVQVVRRMNALIADLHAAAPEERRAALMARHVRLERLVHAGLPGWRRSFGCVRGRSTGPRHRPRRRRRDGTSYRMRIARRSHLRRGSTQRRRSDDRTEAQQPGERTCTQRIAATGKPTPSQHGRDVSRS